MAKAEVIPHVDLYDYADAYKEVKRGSRALEHYHNTVNAEDQKNTKSVADMVKKLRTFKFKQFDNVHLRMRKKHLNKDIAKAIAKQKKTDLQLVLMEFELNDLKSDSREMQEMKMDKSDQERERDRANADLTKANRE